MLVIDGETVNRLLSLEACLQTTHTSLLDASAGTARQALRAILDLPGPSGRCLSVMHGTIEDSKWFGAKVMSVFPDNSSHGLQSHQGIVVLFEAGNGRPVAVLDGGVVTGWRTAAASAIATRVLSRPESSRLAVFGCGEQARRHIDAICAVRNIKEIRIWGRDVTRAEALAQEQRTRQGLHAVSVADGKAAAAGADIICTLTASPEPILLGDWLEPGMHVNVVGASVANHREIDTSCVARSQIWVDHMPMTLHAAGEIRRAIEAKDISEDHIRGEIGQVLSGQIRGRQSDCAITMYRSLGMPAQDIHLARFVFRAAAQENLGISIPF